jgi:hypothetical protein
MIKVEELCCEGFQYGPIKNPRRKIMLLQVWLSILSCKKSPRMPDFIAVLFRKGSTSM